MARLLLTGATGFIGAAVLERLVAEGHAVTALHSGRMTPPPRHGVRWQALDLLKAAPAEIAALGERDGITHCIHAAWYTNHADYLTAEINRDWLEASLRLASGFRAGGGRRFIGLGTCLEYDVTGNAPLSEAATSLRPDTLYARCKAETWDRLRADNGGEAGLAWLRVFFVYGPGDRGTRLVPYLVDNLGRGEPVEARYGGARRDYVHVDDLAAQICRVALSSFEGAVNVGTGRAVSIAEIFRLAGELTGRADLVTANDRTESGGSDLIEADMTRYRESVGPLETRSLEEGLAELIGGGP
jgi:nucleoside-diphosphate-sugar epimerase